MGHWFNHRIIETGRLPLFCFFACLVLAFSFIRLSVRMIRAQVKWWPGNVTPGGLHIHHVVFGVVFMIVGGVAGISISDEKTIWLAGSASLFGIGTALVLDEFALILHLKDVYWGEQGRTSVDAVFVAVALTGLLLLGVKPFGLEDVTVYNDDGAVSRNGTRAVVVFTLLVNGLLAVLTLLKGKIWTGLVGIFMPVLLIFGAIRLARPSSPWAHWRYPADSRKMARAIRRERRYRHPVIKAKIYVQELISGRHG
ncbi:membrane protein [Longispora fulva]|uniref:Integral membrane protein n=1 Tax=Longispora fulva TaxID=619741 RepID=A0A8J7KTM6_9ACTN|nr:hypothetical protein [Longispora fulva]MBG6140907.1 hypothetical protein [Longispora fulva]GIG60827.1 membrane protein [Longispora fulva]